MMMMQMMMVIVMVMMVILLWLSLLLLFVVVFPGIFTGLQSPTRPYLGTSLPPETRRRPAWCWRPLWLSSWAGLPTPRSASCPPSQAKMCSPPQWPWLQTCWPSRLPSTTRWSTSQRTLRFGKRCSRRWWDATNVLNYIETVHKNRSETELVSEIVYNIIWFSEQQDLKYRFESEK